MKGTRSVAVVLVFLLIAAFAGGCQSTATKSPETASPAASSTSTTATGTAEPTASEAPALYTVKIITSTNIKNSSETEVGKILQNKFNINFDFLPFSGNYEEKLGLMLSAGDYPEALNVDAAMLTKYVQAGAALPLDDYLADMPNFTQRYSYQIPIWRKYTSDGKLYNWEYQLTNKNADAAAGQWDIAVRVDELEKQGWPKLLSCSSYLEFFKKAMQDVPTTLGQKTIGLTAPMAESWGLQALPGVMWVFGDKIQQFAGNNVCLWNVAENKYEDYLLEPEVKESIKFFNDCYQAGVLDKECFTDTTTQVESKLNSGTALGTFYCAWLCPTANQMLEKAGHPELEYVHLPMQLDSQVARNSKVYYSISKIYDAGTVILTKACKEPKRLMQLVDYLASDDGQTLLQAGIEGETYNIVDGKRVPTDSMLKMDTKTAEKIGIVGASYLNPGYGLFGWVFDEDKNGQNFSFNLDPVYADAVNLTQKQRDVYKSLGYTTSADWFIQNGKEIDSPLPAGLSLDPQSDLAKLEQKIVDFRIKYTAKLMLAKDNTEFDSIWAEMVANYAKLKPETVVDKYNEMYQEAAAKLNK